MLRPVVGSVALAALLSGCAAAGGATRESSTSGPSTTVPATTLPSTTVAPSTTAAPQPEMPQHVFVIMLENTSYDESFGPTSAMPYLANELTAQGLLLSQFYGIAHNSLTNYLAQISGQAPNPSTQGSCVMFTEFVPTGTGEHGQLLGDGCVYPSSVLTIGDQLAAAGLTWRAYGQDMAADPAQAGSCRHPEIGTKDTDQSALPEDGYATRHMPFVYFHSIIDSPDCAANVVDLGEFEADIATVAGTPNLAYLVPGLCDDGHDTTCADGSAGGAPRADQWLRSWVPKILASPAMAAGGLLIITFDEAETGGDLGDASSCCGDLPAPNLSGPAGFNGPGGGRIGAVLIGAAVAPGSVSDTAYNHYSLLCSLEQLWGLELLGYAGHPSTPCFGADVYNAVG